MEFANEAETQANNIYHKLAALHWPVYQIRAIGQGTKNMFKITDNLRARAETDGLLFKKKSYHFMLDEQQKVITCRLTLKKFLKPISEILSQRQMK